MMSETEQKKPHKGAYILPNMFTTVSMFLGFLSMIWAGQGQFEDAGLAILVSALMDGLDGKVARLTHTASEFGVQYDSLADLIAFGLAPAMFFWHWQLHSFGRLGIACAFIFAACGALRLARFNVSTASMGKRFFMGLPIPAAGCTAVTFYFFATLLPNPLSGALGIAVSYFALVLLVGLGILMVSRVRYFSFKEYDIFRAHPIRTMLAFLFLLAMVGSYPSLFGFLVSMGYIVGGLVHTFVLMPRRDRQMAATSPGGDA